MQVFQPAMIQSQQDITNWVNKACKFFNHRHPGGLSLKFPNPSDVSVSPTLPASKSPKPGISMPGEKSLDWLLENPVGNTVARSAYYILNRMIEPNSSTPTLPVNSPDLQTAYKTAVEDYRRHLSASAFSTLRDPEQIALSVIRYQSLGPSSEMRNKRYQLQILPNVLEGLTEDLQSLKEP